MVYPVRHGPRTVSWSTHCETLAGPLPLFCASSRSAIPPSGSVRRIVAVSIGGLGDTILFSPVLKALRARYPEGRIELLLASPLAREVFLSADEIDSVQFVDTNHPRFADRVGDLIRYAIRCRRQGGADIGVFATGLNPKLALLLKVFADIRLAYRAPQVPAHGTDLICNLNLARRFDPGIRGSDVFVPLSQEAVTQANRTLRQVGIDPKRERLVALYPSTDLPHRPRWPLSAFQDVLRVLRHREPTLKFIVIGSAAEGADWSRFDTARSVDAVLAGRIPIAVTTALLAQCRLTLGNDGGLMHAAGAVGCPLVAIMTTTPANYRPPGPFTIVVQLGAAGNPNDGLLRPAVGSEEPPQVETIAEACLNLLSLTSSTAQGGKAV